MHGFRSTFSDWAGERTSFPKEICEYALAHKVDSEVEGAYRQNQMIEKRRPLMDAWAAFCTGPSNVVSLRAA